MTAKLEAWAQETCGGSGNPEVDDAVDASHGLICWCAACLGQ